MAKRTPPLPKIKLGDLGPSTQGRYDPKTNTITINEETKNKTQALLHEIGHWSFQHGRDKRKTISLEEFIEQEIDAELFAYKHGAPYTGDRKHWIGLVNEVFEEDIDVYQEETRKLILAILKRKKAPKEWVKSVQGLRATTLKAEKISREKYE